VQAQLDLGRVAGLTCRIMLKEYPAATRSLGDNELRAYEALWGSLPDERLPFASLLEELPHLEDAAGASATLWPVPKLHGAWRRVAKPKPSAGGGCCRRWDKVGYWGRACFLRRVL